MRFTEFLESVMQDLHYAARGLIRRPAFTTVAVLTLAIGVGATTAIYSAVNVLLLRPLPYARPDELMKLSLVVPARDDQPQRDGMVWSYPKYTVFRDAQHVFSDLAIYSNVQVTLTSGDVERIPAEYVSATLFARAWARAVARPRFRPVDRRARRRPEPDDHLVRALATALQRRSVDRRTYDRHRPTGVDDHRRWAARFPRAVRPGGRAHAGDHPTRGRVGAAAEPLALARRAPRARCGGGPSGARDGRARSASERGRSRQVQQGAVGSQGVAVERFAARAGGQAISPRPVRRRRTGVAHRVRQRGEPAARTRERAQPRDGRESRHRCRPFAAHSTSAHRESAARLPRRGGKPRRRVGGRARARHDRSVDDAPRGARRQHGRRRSLLGDLARLERARVRARRFARRRSAVRPRSRARRRARFDDRRPQGGSRATRWRRYGPTHARRRRGGARSRAARRDPV